MVLINMILYMLKQIKKKLITLKNLNWKWAYKYYKKRFFMEFFYNISKIKKKKILGC